MHDLDRKLDKSILLSLDILSLHVLQMTVPSVKSQQGKFRAPRRLPLSVPSGGRDAGRVNGEGEVVPKLGRLMSPKRNLFPRHCICLEAASVDFDYVVLTCMCSEPCCKVSRMPQNSCNRDSHSLQ